MHVEPNPPRGAILEEPRTSKRARSSELNVPIKRNMWSLAMTNPGPLIIVASFLTFTELYAQLRVCKTVKKVCMKTISRARVFDTEDVLVVATIDQLLKSVNKDSKIQYCYAYITTAQEVFRLTSYFPALRELSITAPVGFVLSRVEMFYGLLAGNFPNLETLTLREICVEGVADPMDISQFSRLRMLEELEIVNISWNGYLRGMEEVLRSCPLKALELTGLHFADAVNLPSLASEGFRLETLERIFVDMRHGTKLPCEFKAFVEVFPNLRYLNVDVGDGESCDQNVKYLSVLTMLEEAELDLAELSEVGVRCFMDPCAFPNLKVLTGCKSMELENALAEKHPDWILD